MMSTNELRGWFWTIVAILASMAGHKSLTYLFAFCGAAAFVLDLLQNWSKRHDR